MPYQVWAERIIESLLVLPNSSDPLSSFNIGKDCISFGDKKLGVTFQYFLSTSYQQQPLPDGQSLLNPTLWRTFKLGKPSLPSLIGMTMTIMTWESQFTAAFKRIESSRSGPAHHYWSNTALSDHHNGMVVMKIKLWTPNTSTATRFSTFCNIVRGMTRPIPPIWPALTT